jgi:hypothetical protein
MSNLIAEISTRLSVFEIGARFSVVSNGQIAEIGARFSVFEIGARFSVFSNADASPC